MCAILFCSVFIFFFHIVETKVFSLVLNLIQVVVNISESSK